MKKAKKMHNQGPPLGVPLFDPKMDQKTPPGGGLLVHFGVKKWHTKGGTLVVHLFGLFHRGFLRTVFGG